MNSLIEFIYVFFYVFSWFLYLVLNFIYLFNLASLPPFIHIVFSSVRVGQCLIADADAGDCSSFTLFIQVINLPSAGYYLEDSVFETTSEF